MAFLSQHSSAALLSAVRSRGLKSEDFFGKANTTLPFIQAMFRSKLLEISFVLLAFAGCSNSKQPANSAPTLESKKVTSAGVVNAQPQTIEINAGQSASAVVRLVIQPGYHLNANPPTYPYLIATELKFEPSEGISVGKVTYPPPVTTKFAFAEKPLAVYEGETELKAELKTEKTAPKGNRFVGAILRIQACDDQVCYPPGTIDLQIPVTIK